MGHGTGPPCFSHDILTRTSHNSASSSPGKLDVRCFLQPNFLIIFLHFTEFTHSPATKIPCNSMIFCQRVYFSLHKAVSRRTDSPPLSLHPYIEKNINSSFEENKFSSPP